MQKWRKIERHNPEGMLRKKDQFGKGRGMRWRSPRWGQQIGGTRVQGWDGRLRDEFPGGTDKSGRGGLQPRIVRGAGLQARSHPQDPAQIIDLLYYSIVPILTR